MAVRPAAWPPAWLAQARALGASAVELDLRLEAGPGEIVAVLDGHGLALAGAACVGGLLELTPAEERRRLAPVLERSLAAGNALLAYTEFTRHVREHDSVSLADRPRLRRDDLRRYGERLTQLADWIAGEGGSLAYLPRPGTAINGAAEIDLLLDSSDTSVGLALDSGAVALADAEPDLIGLVRRHRERLRHLRLQAVDATLLAQAREAAWSCPRLVAAGTLGPPVPAMTGPELAALAAVLRELGYGGWLVAATERPPAAGETAEAAASALEALAACLR